MIFAHFLSCYNVRGVQKKFFFHIRGEYLYRNNCRSMNYYVLSFNPNEMTGIDKNCTE